MLKRKNAFIKPSTAKPKAKAKAKNEAKPKGKAKASGKDANEKGEPKAPAQVNLTIEALKQGVPEEARDKGKAQRYAKERDNLPQYVRVLIDEESRKSGHKRAWQSAAMNRLYSRQSDGSLSLNLSDPLFQQASTMYESGYSRNEDQAYPASIMRNRFFNGSKHEFDTALAEGDIYETTGKDDKVMYAFNTMTVGIEQEKRTDHKVTAKKSIDKNTFQELMAAYHNVGWKFSKKQAEAMVDDEGVMAGAALTLVDQALASLDKINKETGALLKSKQPFEKEMLSSLKQGYAKSTGFVQTLNQLKDFHIMPDGSAPTKKTLDTFFMEVALRAQKLNKKVEEAKGHLRANSK